MAVRAAPAELATARHRDRYWVRVDDVSGQVWSECREIVETPEDFLVGAVWTADAASTVEYQREPLMTEIASPAHFGISAGGHSRWIPPEGLVSEFWMGRSQVVVAGKDPLI